MPHKRLQPRKFRIVARFAAGAALAVVACESTQPVSSSPDAAAQASGQASTASASQPASRPSPKGGPRRLEARRPGAPDSGTSADPTAALMNPGDELEPSPVRARPGPAPQGLAADSPSQPSADAGAGGGRPASASERAAAARMAAENDARRKAQAAEAAARDAARNDPDSDRGAWSVLLATASGSGSRETAEAIREQVVRRYPQLRDAFVRSTGRGSVVLVGHFDGPQDPAAKAQLKVVKELNEGNVRAFPRAMLTRLSASADQGPSGPNDLRSVRAQFPTGTLYSLQVAVWSAFGTDELKASEVKRAAENHCRQLRSQGEEAYFFHDFDTRTSTVTVGVFGPDAYDPRSTLYAPEVEAVMRKHPKHLVNGEELLVPVDPANPRGKTMPQAPRLVEIPKL